MYIFLQPVWYTFDNSAFFGLLSCATATESRLHVLWSKSPPIHFLYPLSNLCLVEIETILTVQIHVPNLLNQYNAP